MTDSLTSNPWTTLTTTSVYESPWIHVKKNEVLMPSGKPGIYSVVHFKNLAIGILPIDEEGNIWLVGQFRYPVNEYSWEIPEGGGSLQIDPLLSAQRELLEETGLKAAEWTELMRLHLSNSATDEYAIVYTARGLTFHTAEPEETEVLQVKKLPFDEAYRMVMDGQITDAITVAAILKAKILFDPGKK
jgi:ADP-ribose pyrophosphatase